MPFEDSYIGRNALILLSLKAASRLQGRIKVQKILYLSNLCGWNCIKDYRYYNYGPYSDSISTDLETFKRNGWIHEETFGSADGKQGHTYYLTSQGQKIADSLAGKIENPGLIKRTTELVEALNNYTSDDLEIMSTLVFLSRSEPNLSERDLISRVVELKPRFDEKQVRGNLRVFRMLKDFGYAAK
jgi:uncharacterized protein YwgA